jgi:hypothetical protein
MRNIFHLERFLQLFIILACCLLLIFRISSEHATAQFSCLPDRPPFMNSISPQSEAWPQFSNVSVVIFERSNGQSTSTDDFNAIDAAIREWNTVAISGCSNVIFGNATHSGRVWGGLSDAPPTNTVYVVRTTDRSGQWQGFFTSAGMVSGWLYMHSDYTMRTRDPYMRVDNLAKHEAAHSFGLGNGTHADPPSIYSQNSLTGPGETLVITQCDVAAHRRVYCPTPSPTPTPTPTPEPTPPPSSCNGVPDFNQYPSGCASGLVATGGICTNSPVFMNHCNLFGGYDYESCGCYGMCDPSVGGCSPVVVDVLGNGFQMTSAANGVMFDLQGNGTQQQFSWIAAGSDDSWLALDRNNNGLIDSGRELFGNVTSQPPPPDGEEMNGFLALAQYDTAAFGGNSDGKINQQDAIFSRLRLWQDENHNGISETCELKTLPEAGLRKIDLDYRTSRRTDEFGNQFKYKAKVRDAQDAQLGRWAWDVFLVVQH